MSAITGSSPIAIAPLTSRALVSSSGPPANYNRLLRHPTRVSALNATRAPCAPWRPSTLYATEPGSTRHDHHIARRHDRSGIGTVAPPQVCARARKRARSPRLHALFVTRSHRHTVLHRRTLMRFNAHAPWSGSTAQPSPGHTFPKAPRLRPTELFLEPKRNGKVDTDASDHREIVGSVPGRPNESKLSRFGPREEREVIVVLAGRSRLQRRVGRPCYERASWMIAASTSWGS